jgi:hypothetical protein
MNPKRLNGMHSTNIVVDLEKRVPLSSEMLLKAQSMAQL